MSLDQVTTARCARCEKFVHLNADDYHVETDGAIYHPACWNEGRVLGEYEASQARVVAEVRGSYIERVDAMIAEQRRRADLVDNITRVIINQIAREVVRDLPKCEPGEPETCLHAVDHIRVLFSARTRQEPTRNEMCAINVAAKAAWEARASGNQPEPLGSIDAQLRDAGR